MATSAALALSVSKIVSTSSRSAPPGDERPHLLLVGGLHLVEGDHAEAGIVGVGRVRERDGERANSASDKALAAGFRADASGPFAALAGGLLVDLPGEIAEERVVNDLLVELGILAAAVLARVVDKELALRDGGCAEGVGLNDVGPGLKEAAMDIADDRGLRESEQVAVIEQVLLRVLEALAADADFVHPVGAQGGACRAVDDGDAAFKELRERMVEDVSHFFSMVYGPEFRISDFAAWPNRSAPNVPRRALGCGNPCLNGTAGSLPWPLAAMRPGN